MDGFRRIGDCLATEFRLTGLVGVDAIVNRRGVWPVEVNPRYTASVEVLERALDIPTLGWHVDACVRGCLPAVPKPNRRGLAWCGKAILFAERPLEIDERLTANVGRIFNPSADGSARLSECWPPIANVPMAGSRIAAHRPILTVFSAGTTRAKALAKLRTAARRWHAELAR